MDRFWKWLMHMDARGIFVVSLLLFLAMTGWWAWQEFRRPLQTGRPRPAAGQPVPLPPQHTLGVLAFVSNQFRPEALVVPVNPFRPTYEALVRHQADEVVHGGRLRPDGRPFNMTNFFIRRPRLVNPVTNTPPANASVPPPPVPTLTYRGMFQRPDGRIAAYVHDSTTGAGRFVGEGDNLHGALVVTTEKTALRLRLPDGEERDIRRGESVTLGAPQP